MAEVTGGTSDRPLVLIHGYSSSDKAFGKWREVFAGRQMTNVHVGKYVTLSNEVTIKDIAEGLNRALEAVGIGRETPFDAVVHSTGMLVIRSWLVTYGERRARLKHLIGLAPASFGSPLAHKGRSWLGKFFKGNKDIGPDFLEAGDEVLDALELGSRFTWDLAERDLFGSEPMYGPDSTTPYVFIFCGNSGYKGIRGWVSEEGTDGTVRFAGCSLNSRKVVVDLTQAPLNGATRAEIADWKNVSDIPLVFVEGRDHGSIMNDPPTELQDLVVDALQVDDESGLQAWCARAMEYSSLGGSRVRKKWQQFVVRVVDERGDPVPDYNASLYLKRAGKRETELVAFRNDVHAYERDKSLRNFHVDVTALLDPGSIERLQLRLIASSGSQLVGYRGFSSIDREDDGGIAVEEVCIDLKPLLLKESTDTGREFRFFYPNTTTLVEIRTNREPLPYPGPSKVYEFIES